MPRRHLFLHFNHFETIGSCKLKRSLIAMAILAATGTAMAQSSVNMYGTADVALGRLRFGNSGMQSNTAVNTSGSYLGFKGVEDLGSGLKTGFVLEQGIDLKNGASDANTFQRAANLWIGDTWGTVRAGRAYTPSYNAMSAWDLMGRDVNSIAVHTYGPVGGHNGFNQNSQLSYKTPSISGFTAEAAYVFKTDNNNQSKYDLGLVYANGPLTAGFAYNKTQSLDASYAFGGQYNFGMFDVATGYYHSYYSSWRNDATGLIIQGATGKSNGFTIGGRVRWGAASVALDLSKTTSTGYQVDGVNFDDKKHTNITIHGRYALSKRTFVYANYLNLNDKSLYGFGMRHDF